MLERALDWSTKNRILVFFFRVVAIRAIAIVLLALAGMSSTNAAENTQAATLEALLDLAAERGEMPRHLSEQLKRQLDRRDLARAVSSNVTIRLRETLQPNRPETQSIESASVTFDGTAIRIYRFRASSDGPALYYYATGESVDRIIPRKPSQAGGLRRGFGVIRHPILNYTRLHRGTDWEMKVGTPVVLDAPGTVTQVETVDGLPSRTVALQITDDLRVIYGNVSPAKPIRSSGTHVEPGQTLGFVLPWDDESASYVHYGVRLKDHYVDPLTAELPPRETLSDAALDSFQQERERLVWLEADSSQSFVITRER